MTTPNLDCMDPGDLVDLAIRAKCRPVIMARIWFPGRPKGYVKATRDLEAYAWNKATSITCRRRGDILGAQSYGAICDRIYSDLPEWARW